ncbi:hypothetical protein CHUAL_008038 [Chamberlinius hualienensis]
MSQQRILLLLLLCHLRCLISASDDDSNGGKDDKNCSSCKLATRLGYSDSHPLQMPSMHFKSPNMTLNYITNIKFNQNGSQTTLFVCYLLYNEFDEYRMIFDTGIYGSDMKKTIRLIGEYGSCPEMLINALYPQNTRRSRTIKCQRSVGRIRQVDIGWTVTQNWFLNSIEVQHKKDKTKDTWVLEWSNNLGCNLGYKGCTYVEFYNNNNKKYLCKDIPGFQIKENYTGEIRFNVSNEATIVYGLYFSKTFPMKMDIYLNSYGCDDLPPPLKEQWMGRSLKINENVTYNCSDGLTFAGTNINEVELQCNSVCEIVWTNKDITDLHCGKLNEI